MPEAEREVKIVKKAEILADSGKALREAAHQMTGQANRTNNLFVDVLLDVIERLDRLEARQSLSN